MEIPSVPTPEFYRRVIQRGDKERVVYKMNNEAERGNKVLLYNLRNAWMLAHHPAATAARQGASLRTNVDFHLKNRHFYMLDIYKAFPSIKPWKLARILNEYGVFPSEQAATAYLHDYCIDPATDGLRQGINSAPDLFNAYCFNLDNTFARFCTERGLRYTRYIDDITISAPKGETFGKKRRAKIRDMILEYGFDIAHRKSRLHSLDNGPVTITGISLYPDGHYQLSPILVEKIREGFDEIEAILEANNGFLTPKQQGRLHGLHGIITSTHDIRQPELSAIEQRLTERYRSLRLKVNRLNKKLGRQAAQKTLFSSYAFKACSNTEGGEVDVDQWERINELRTYKRREGVKKRKGQLSLDDERG